MRFLRMLRVHLQQVFSWKLLLYGAGIAILQIGASAGLVSDIASVWYVTFIGMATGSIFFTLHVMPTLAYSTTLISEWNVHAAPYWMIRGSVKQYTYSKMIAAAVAGALSVFIGLFLQILIFSTFLPMYTTSVSDCPYETFLEQGKLFAGFAAFLWHYSLSGAIVAVFGMFVSAFINSPYVAVVSPLALYLTLSRLLANRGYTGILAPDNWVGSIHHSGSAAQTLIEKTIFAVIVIWFMCMGASAYMKRRVQNE